MNGHKLLWLIWMSLYMSRDCSGCKVLNWKHWSMEDFLAEAEIVLYGQETGRSNYSDGTFSLVQDAQFEVYCIFKYDNITIPIPNNITFPRVFPQHTCSGTQIHVGKQVILAAKRDENGLFYWDEVNAAPDGAAFDASPANLQQVALMDCCSQFMLPVGGSSVGCPAVTTVPTDSATVGDGGGATGLISCHVAVLISVVFCIHNAILGYKWMY